MQYSSPDDEIYPGVIQQLPDSVRTAIFNRITRERLSGRVPAPVTKGEVDKLLQELRPTITLKRVAV